MATMRIDVLSGGGIAIGGFGTSLNAVATITNNRIWSNVLHWADVATVSVVAPTNVIYSVDGGAGRAGNAFLVLFSFSGTHPGFDFNGLHLPLNLDQVTFALTSFVGVLNGGGQGSVVFPLGSLFLPRSLIGQRVSTAAAIVGPGPVLSAFTNDENVTIVQ